MTYGGLRAAVFIGAVRTNAVFETSTGKAVLSFYGRQLKFICRMGTSGKDLVPAIRRYFGILSPLVLAAKSRVLRSWYCGRSAQDFDLSARPFHKERESRNL